MSEQNLVFSHLKRSEEIARASKLEFDLIVIGGGITGAGIVLDAVLRGMQVLLIEKADFASGTSSKSTKLIHGGLRYLKQFEFGLVRDTGRERAVAHHNAYHLVHPENMLLPIVKKGSFGQLSASIAIAVYDRLAGVKKAQRRRKLSKKDTLLREPTLTKEKLKSGILYSEYRTDDYRFTVELIKAAKRNSACVFNYMEFEKMIQEEGEIRGLSCLDKTNGKQYSFTGKKIVSAAGPWVDGIRLKDNSDSQTNLHLTKGSHIVLSREKLPIAQAIYFDAFDGRMLFAIPRRDSVYVGTTDTTYTSDLDSPTCSREDAEYILNAVNRFFDIPTLTIHHVKSSWSGLRPLIQQAGKGPTELSRKDEIFYSDSGLISIAGGKLTGYRTMAERVVDVVSKMVDASFKECQTQEYKIHCDSFSSYEEYLSWVDTVFLEYKDVYSKDEIRELCDNYGKDSLTILKNSSRHQKLGLVLAQLEHCLRYESVFHPLDFFERRTGWLYFNIEKVRKSLEAVVDYMYVHFSWSPELKLKVLSDCTRALSTNGLEEFKA